MFRGIPTFIRRPRRALWKCFLDRYLAAERGGEPALISVLDGYGITWTFMAPQQAATSRLDSFPDGTASTLTPLPSFTREATGNPVSVGRR